MTHGPPPEVPGAMLRMRFGRGAGKGGGFAALTLQQI